MKIWFGLAVERLGAMDCKSMSGVVFGAVLYLLNVFFHGFRDNQVCGFTLFNLDIIINSH